MMDLKNIYIVTNTVEEKRLASEFLSKALKCTNNSGGRIMKYKPGDKVLIVSRRTPHMNRDGLMDKYLDTVMTVGYICCGTYRMVEDFNDRPGVFGGMGMGWIWYEDDIVCLESEMQSVE